MRTPVLVAVLCLSLPALAQDFDGRETSPTPPVMELSPAPRSQGPAQGTDTRAWVTVRANTPMQRTKISEAGVSIEQVEPGRIGGIATARAVERLKRAGFAVEAVPLGVRFSALGFPAADSAFHDYAELEADVKALAAKAPDLVSVRSIGTSGGGRPIWGIRLNTTARGDALSEKPGIIFLGTHHAREHLSTEIPLMLAQHLVENRQKADIKALLETRDIFIVPMVNPDGVEHDIRNGRYHMHRKNTRDNGDGSIGVDLNRNYAYRWGGPGASDDPDSDIYHGPSAFSEPETQAVKRLVDRHAANVKVLLSYHTFSELILYPWGGAYEDIEDSRALAAYKAMAGTMAEMTGYTPQKSSELYIATGDTTDWSWATHGIYSFTFELTPKSMWSGGFYPGAAAIQPTFAANLRPALYLIRMAADPSRAADGQAVTAAR